MIGLLIPLLSRFKMPVMIVVGLGICWGYYTYSSSVIEGLRADNAAAVTMIQTQQTTFKTYTAGQDAVRIQMKTDYANIIVTLGVLSDLNNAQSTAIVKLSDKFERKGKKSFEELATSKPGLITKIVNKGADQRIRCFQIVTGSPLTEEENNDNYKKNTVCPDAIDRVRNP